MRISDWSSDVCSSDLRQAVAQGRSRAQLYAKTSPVKLVEPTMWHAMEAATIGGARGLGRKDLGRIQAGAKADLCTISIDQLLVGIGNRAPAPPNHELKSGGSGKRGPASVSPGGSRN